MEELHKALKIAFASEFSFYLKAHNYHWNVTGSDFAQFHSFFGDVYQEVWESVDDYAEHIRALDEFPFGGLTEFSRITLLQDASILRLPVTAMLRQLDDDNQTILAALDVAHNEATQVEEYGITNFLEERIDYHQKLGWKLKAFNPAVM